MEAILSGKLSDILSLNNDLYALFGYTNGIIAARAYSTTLSHNQEAIIMTTYLNTNNQLPLSNEVCAQLKAAFEPFDTNPPHEIRERHWVELRSALIAVTDEMDAYITSRI